MVGYTGTARFITDNSNVILVKSEGMIPEADGEHRLLRATPGNDFSAIARDQSVSYLYSPSSAFDDGHMAIVV